MRRAGLSILALSGISLAITAAEAQPTRAPAVRTIPLTTPVRGISAWEPSIAIDPRRPDHLVVGAMCDGDGTWATRICAWHSADAGRSWTADTIVATTFGGAKPDKVADAVVAFAPDGDILLGSMAEGKQGSGVMPGGVYLSRRNPTGPGPWRTTRVVANAIDSALGVAAIIDKPVLLVDHGAASGHAGSLYLSWGATLLKPAADLQSKPYLVASRDAGVTFAPPRQLAPSGFGATFVAGPSGALDGLLLRPIGMQAAANALAHLRSTDGGRTVGTADTLVVTRGDTVLELPALGARPDGSLLVCWPQGPAKDEHANLVRCARRARGDRLGAPSDLDPRALGGATPAWPAIVGTERAWYVLLYLAGKTSTDVALLRSADGARFERVATLATLGGIGADRFCLRSATRCRREPGHGFIIGDYVSLSAAGNRLAAVYVVPASAGSIKTMALSVSVFDELP